MANTDSNKRNKIILIVVMFAASGYIFAKTFLPGLGKSSANSEFANQLFESQLPNMSQAERQKVRAAIAKSIETAERNGQEPDPDDIYRLELLDGMLESSKEGQTTASEMKPDVKPKPVEKIIEDEEDSKPVTTLSDMGAIKFFHNTNKKAFVWDIQIPASHLEKKELTIIAEYKTDSEVYDSQIIFNSKGTRLNDPEGMFDLQLEVPQFLTRNDKKDLILPIRLNLKGESTGKQINHELMMGGANEYVIKSASDFRISAVNEKPELANPTNLFKFETKANNMSVEVNIKIH